VEGPLRSFAAALILASTLTAAPAGLAARGAAEDDGRLVVGAVQFAASQEVYRSLPSFHRAVDRALDRVETEARRRGRPLDLVVFPEYTSAFLAFSRIPPEKRRAVQANPAAHRDLIRRAVESTRRDVRVFWSETARRRGYAILAGTTLVVDGDGGFRNRALLFSRRGELVHRQDKAFPGAPEAAVLDLETGDPSAVDAFRIDGRPIVLTICRDTYHAVWERVLPPADLWIDIKANELPYTRDYYDGALPSRLPSSPTDHGLTVSLAGEMLGYRFSGPTEFLDDSERKSATGPWEENGVLVVELPY